MEKVNFNYSLKNNVYSVAVQIEIYTGMLSVLGLGAVQIELSIWQHRIALQLCVAHCLRSLSSLRCGVEKSLRTTNETIFLAHINLSVGNACQNALCSADDATKAETAAVRRLSIYIYIYVCIMATCIFAILVKM